eukprot:5444302-Prymnesium_polylepis.2
MAPLAMRTGRCRVSGSALCPSAKVIRRHRPSCAFDPIHSTPESAKMTLLFGSTHLRCPIYWPQRGEERPRYGWSPRCLPQLSPCGAQRGKCPAQLERGAELTCRHPRTPPYRE